jgi:hypothetical protein
MKSRYNLAFTPLLDKQLGRASRKLRISKAEVLRRSLELFVRALEANEVKFVTNEGEESVVVNRGKVGELEKIRED